MPKSRLDDIVENKRLEVAQRKRKQSTLDLEKRIKKASQLFLRAISSSQGTNLIAELKPKSPSLGQLQHNIPVDKILEAYDRFACAVSVLTDEKYFGGSLDLLSQASKKLTRPTLCKDFIIDPHQCFEARLNGAQAVLLIVKILERRELFRLHSIICDLGMTPVVEVQTEDELSLATSCGAKVILINNRDLTTFAIDLATTERLAPLVSKGTKIVAASGIEERSHIERLSSFTNTFLVGSSLMQAQDLGAKLTELAGEPVMRKESVQ